MILLIKIFHLATRKSNSTPTYFANEAHIRNVGLKNSTRVGRFVSEGSGCRSPSSWLGGKDERGQVVFNVSRNSSPSGYIEQHHRTETLRYL